jgi:hypothetical protein
MGNPARKIEQITNWSAISVVFFIPKSLNLDRFIMQFFTQFILFPYSFNISENAIFMYIYVLFDPEND